LCYYQRWSEKLLIVVPKTKATEATKIAIDAGFRHIDSACMYQNEEEVGLAIRSKIAEGIVKRDDIFYTSKLWCTFHRPELVQFCLEQSLKKLQLDYVDLYLIHFPISLKPAENYLETDENGKFIFDTVDFRATWEAMEKCKDAGLAKSIGVSNFNCRVEQNTPILLDDPVLGSMAKKYKRTPALIALRYQLQRGVVVLAKSFTEKRIKENMQVFEFQLSLEDMKVLDGLNKNIRYLSASSFEGHPDFPFSDEY
ncbi:hypothetical protein STEG23_033766, partial [Scotinomys teguina]